MVAGERVFLKLGGSVLTDKSTPKTPRIEVIQCLANQITAALDSVDLELLLGHGSGSYGHWAAKEYAPLKRTDPKMYVSKVHAVAAELNHIVVSALVDAGVRAIHYPPSAVIFARDGVPSRLCLGALTEMIEQGFVPVTYGDAVPDAVRGGAIFSTERVFLTLNPVLKPRRILLVSDVNGVYTSDPHDDPNAEHIPEITPENFPDVREALGGAKGFDVTGGMLAKVESMLQLVQTSPWVDEVQLLSANDDNLLRALRGEHVGTVIHL